jgi:hypothetical protein
MTLSPLNVQPLPAAERDRLGSGAGRTIVGRPSLIEPFDCGATGVAT